MNENLEKEKKQAISGFEKRRGLLEVIKNNIFSMSGRFSGIAGSSILGLNDSNEFDSSEKLLEILSDNEWTC